MKFFESFCPGTGRDRGIWPGTFAPALVPGQRDTRTRFFFFVPDVPRDVPSLGNTMLNCTLGIYHCDFIPCWLWSSCMSPRTFVLINNFFPSCWRQDWNLWTSDNRASALSTPPRGTHFWYTYQYTKLIIAQRILNLRVSEIGTFFVLLCSSSYVFYSLNYLSVHYQIFQKKHHTYLFSCDSIFFRSLINK